MRLVTRGFPVLRARWTQGIPPPPPPDADREDEEPHSGLAHWSTQYANLPQRFMLRKSRRLVYKTPAGSQCFKNEIITGRIPDFTLDRYRK